MKNPASPLNLDNLLTSAESEPHATMHELILREYFLMCAIEKMSHRTESISSICDETLLSDLQSNQDFLHHLSEGVLIPAVAALTSEAGRQWELNLLAALSHSNCRWESARRLAEELSAITKLLDELSERLPESAHPLSSHRQRLKEHLERQEQILATWVKAELSFGRSAEKVFEKELNIIGTQWESVVAEMLKHENTAPPTLQSWRSFPNAIRLMIHSLLSFGKNISQAA